MAEIIYEADYPSGGQKTGIMDIGGVARTLSATDYKQPPSVILPVLTPEREEKRQNGRRFKDNEEPMFTLTSQDRHGVAIEIEPYETEIRNGLQDHQKWQKDTSPALTAAMGMGGGYTPIITEKVGIEIKEATKQGYAIAHEGDSINLSMPDSKTRRGRVGGGVAQTLDTQCNQGVIQTIQGSIPSDHPGQYVEIYDGIVVYAVWYEKYQCYIAIRKLTPRECFRLQGWTDEYFDRAEFVNSDSQLYKQAGNGVTVNVVEAIAREL